MLKRVLVLALCATTCAAMSSLGCTSTIRVERTLDADGIHHVKVVTFAGDIAVESWSDLGIIRARVGIAGGGAAVAASEVSLIRAGDMATLTVGAPPEHLEDLESEVELKLPAGVSLEVENGAGPVYAEGSFGETRIRTSLGTVRILGADGPVFVETTNGSVNVEGLIDSFHVKTDFGRVRIASERDGPLAAASSVEVEGGRIGVTLPDTVSAMVDAETAKGKLETNFGLAVEEVADGARTSGTLGGGGPAIKLRAGSGSIGLWRFVH